MNDQKTLRLVAFSLFYPALSRCLDFCPQLAADYGFTYLPRFMSVVTDEN
jgi:hypothetical protein